MSNKPITSREYKLMLKTDRFRNRNDGSNEFMDMVVSLIENQGGEVKTDFEEKERRVWYLDTPAFALRQNGYILRLRQEMEAAKQFKLTLKYRHPDRYLASETQVLASAMAEVKYREDDDDIETKFEEDILLHSASKFAYSTSIRMNGRPNLNALADAIDIFPGLETLPIPDDTPMAKVNGFTAQEVKRESGKIDFDMKPKIKPCLSFWYLSDEAGGYPLVTEFSFDYDVLDEEHERLIKHPDRLEHFPLPVVENANIFFNAIQSHLSWFDLTGSTKTAFAYTI
ncbi:MAG: hypothetical protein KDE48_14050 [Anaerolineales bacterium]|nr:hypothetical protein [Anaerolineales bacterium]